MFEAIWLLCATAFLAASCLLLSRLHRWVQRGRTVEEARGNVRAFVRPVARETESCQRCGALKPRGTACYLCDRRAA